MEKASGLASTPISGDNNQPMDLAQKPHNLKIPDMGGGSKSLSAAVVHFGGSVSSKLPPSNSMHGSQGKLGIRMESPGFSLISRQCPNTGNAALNLTSSSGSLKNLSHPASLTITPPTISGPPPTAHSGCHIPRGPAYVANIAAPRSQNIASIVRTTPQNVSTLMASTSIRSNSGQRVIPISTTGNTWNRVTSSTVMAKVPVPSTRSTIVSRSPGVVGNATTISTVNPKSQAFQKTSISGAMRVTESIKMQVPKANSPYPITAPKYITSNNRITSQSTGSANGASCDNIYTPSSSLVTSLASSGTTITPHAINRTTPSAISVRISSATTAQMNVDTSNSGLSPMGISGNPSCTVVPIHPVQTRISGAGSEQHIPLKTPIVRSSSLGSASINKGPGSMPTTQISYGTTKIISQGMAQGFSLSQLSMAKSTSVPQTMPYHTKATASLTPVSKTTNPNHGQTRVLAASGLSHPQSTLASLKTSLPISIADQERHRPSPGKSGCSITILGGTRTDTEVYPSSLGGSSQKPDKVVSSTAHYNINAPYYLESANSSNSQNAVTFTQQMGGHRSSPVNNATNARPPSAPSTQNTSDTPPLSSCLTMTSLKTNASPRPSILRKRPDMEVIPSKVAKNLAASLIGGPISSPPSPKRPDSRGNLFEEDSRTLSTKDISSGEDSQTSCAAVSKVSSNVGSENGMALKNHIQLNIPQWADGVSPRKKPRKQQLMGNELQESKCSEEAFMLRPTKRFKFEISSQENDTPMDHEPDQNSPVNSTRRSLERSPEPKSRKKNHMSLIHTYKVWKSQQNHFKTYKDIKPKEEKKKTVNDIANQKLVIERAKGWKVIHLMGQVDDLVDTEEEVMGKLNGMLTSWEISNRKIQKDSSKELEILSELFKSNIQRSKTIKSQMVDAKVQMNKIFDHKPNILDILSKYSNKRNIRRREKT